MSLTRRTLLRALVALALLALPTLHAAEPPAAVRLDWATYNPVSLVLREQGTLERRLAERGIGVRWVQSLGSNKALEYLNAGSIDFGSTAGGAALLGRANGNPIRTVHVYSQPEWATLVVCGDSPLRSLADLRGKRIAVTRGTDPHIFLLRALATVGLAERDVQLVLLQHADGRTALLRGDVDAWAGLDPLTAGAELEHGARLLYRNPAFNSGGVLNVREAFAAAHPDVVREVLAAYAEARDWALAHPAELTALLAREAKLPEAVVARQLERTRLDTGAVDAALQAQVAAAGEALQAARVIGAEADIDASLARLFAGADARAVAQAR
ncbi:MAG: aliphatic sulfonate ABC transporter substrate-binding protein [Pseudomonadota bacterium]